MVSFNLNFLPKARSPNTVRSGGRALTYEFGGTHSVCSTSHTVLCAHRVTASLDPHGNQGRSAHGTAAPL